MRVVSSISYRPLRLESTSSFYNNQALSIPYEEYRTIEFNSYFDIDHILAEQEKIQVAPTNSSIKLASLFGKTEDAELSSFKSMSNTKIELPFWLAHSLVEHSSVEITDMPRCFRYQSLQAVTSAAENVKLRDYSPYYYRIGCIVIEELESVVTATIRRILVETFKKRLDLIFSKANAQRVVLFHQARQEPGNSGAKSIKNSSLGSMIHNPNTISVVSSGSGIVGASATGILSDFYESLDDLEKLIYEQVVLSNSEFDRWMAKHQQSHRILPTSTAIMSNKQSS